MTSRDDNRKTMSVTQSLEGCAETLGQIYATCCMKKRSTKMDDAYASLQHAISSASELTEVNGEVQSCVESIEAFGGRIGILYATCCTEIRAPLYQQIFRQLQQANLALWRQR